MPGNPLQSSLVNGKNYRESAYGNPLDETVRGGRSDSHQTRHFSLIDDLTLMEPNPPPPTQMVVGTIRTLAKTASTVRRNTQTLFNLISTARDVCEAIHFLIRQSSNPELTEDQRWIAFDGYNIMLDGLERYVGS